jgi:hypothetical protein
MGFRIKRCQCGERSVGSYSALEQCRPCEICGRMLHSQYELIYHPGCSLGEEREVKVQDKLKFTMVFKSGLQTVGIIAGTPIPIDRLSAGDVTERVIQTEQFLERLTGLRVHISSEVADPPTPA